MTILKNQVYDKPNQNIYIQYERDGKIVSSTIFTSSMLIPSGDSIGVIGIRPNFDIIQPSFFGSFYYGFNDLIGWLGIMSQSIISFFSGNLDIKNFYFFSSVPNGMFNCLVVCFSDAGSLLLKITSGQVDYSCTY